MIAMNVKKDLLFLTRLIKGIAAQFGNRCEVVLHDLTEDYENTIIAIENGTVTGRRVGDCASNIVLETLKHEGELKDKYCYLTQSHDGKILKSTSVFIKDDEGKNVGLLCINYDLTDFLMVESIINSFNDVKEDRNIKEIVPANVNELLDLLIKESYDYIGKPVILMTKDDKIKAIKYLDEKGAFLIKKSGDKVSKFYDISKYTLYNYLDADMPE